MNCKYCNRTCKNPNSHRNHERLCKNNPNRDYVDTKNIECLNLKKCICTYCQEKFTIGTIKRHEKGCEKNPECFKICPVCNKTFVGKKFTCSYGCSNTYFRSGKSNPNWSNSNYRSLCFLYHEKRCCVCGEDKIISVHHYDENHDNNEPSNLIPMCPTHHQYMHSRYKGIILEIVDKYIYEFNQSVAQ